MEASTKGFAIKLAFKSCGRRLDDRTDRYLPVHGLLEGNRSQEILAEEVGYRLCRSGLAVRFDRERGDSDNTGQARKEDGHKNWSPTPGVVVASCATRRRSSRHVR